MTSDALIFHLTEREAWRQGLRSGVYRHPSLESEGFIHFSDAHQVAATARRRFAGRDDLVLLVVPESALTDPLKREDTTGRGEAFPHLYGPLPLAAVRLVLDVALTAEGEALLPSPERLTALGGVVGV